MITFLMILTSTFSVWASGGASSINICDRGKIGHLIAKETDASSCAEVNMKAMAQLKVLDISGQGLKKIPPNAFMGLNALEYLILGDNEIPSLEPNIFHNLVSLKILELHNNQIEQILPGAFKGLERLVGLNLTGNKIIKLAQNSFSGLNDMNLEWIALYDNEFCEDWHWKESPFQRFILQEDPCTE